MQQELMAGTANSRLRLDPRTKLFLLIVINVIMMGGAIIGAAVFVRPILALIPFTLLVIEKKWGIAAVYLPLYAVAAFFEIYVVPHTVGIWNLLFIIASSIVSRFMPCLVMGYYLVTTTTVSEFIAAMERMHVSQKIVIPLSVMFRFFPTVLEESRSISDSMRMRGIGGVAALKNPVAGLEYRVVPLMVCTVKIGEELSAAALTRGLGAPGQRTNICGIGFHALDVVCAGIAAASAVCMMIW